MIEMKINFKIRSKNPTYWALVTASFVLPVLAYGGTELSSLTTWSSVWAAITGTLSNPYACLTIFLGLTGTTIDPTSAGLRDSRKALTYDELSGSKDDQVKAYQARLEELEVLNGSKDKQVQVLKAALKELEGGKND